METPTPDVVQVPALPASVPRLRDAARRWARAAGLPEVQVGDVALAVTEAATNAVVHAFVGREAGTITLALEPADGQAVFRVSDDGRGLTPRIDSPGLGLGIPTIGRLADHVDVGPGPAGGTEVCMIFDAPHLTSATALRDRLDAAYGPLSDAVTVNTADGRVVYANAAAAELMGASPEELTQRPVGAIAGEFRITREDGAPVALDDLPHQRLLAGHEGSASLLTRSVHLPTGRARWLLTTATPLDGDEQRGRLALNVIRDVTDETERRHRDRFLARAGERLALAAIDEERMVRELAALAVPELADWCAVDLVDDAGLLRRVALAHRDPDKVALGREIHERWPPDPSRDDGPYRVLRSGEPLVVERITDELLEALPDPGHRAALRELGMRSVIIVPMPTRDAVAGVLTVVDADSARVFGDDDVAFAVEMGRRAGTALDNARRIGG